MLRRRRRRLGRGRAHEGARVLCQACAGVDDRPSLGGRVTARAGLVSGSAPHGQVLAGLDPDVPLPAPARRPRADSRVISRLIVRQQHLRRRHPGGTAPSSSCSPRACPRSTTKPPRCRRSSALLVGARTIASRPARPVRQVGRRERRHAHDDLADDADRPPLPCAPADHVSSMIRAIRGRGSPSLNEICAHEHQDVRVENGTQFGRPDRFDDFKFMHALRAVNVATLFSLANARGRRRPSIRCASC